MPLPSHPNADAVDPRMLERFLTVLQDARIIPGVHHHCDEWCTYCPVTTRCLSFRCTAEWQKHRRPERATSHLGEAVAFTRTLAAVEGLPTEELDAILANPDGGSGLETSDPLASMVWDYAVNAAIVMLPAAKRVADPVATGESPRPEEVVLWYHLRLYFRIVRALIAKERHTAGAGGRLEDAIGSAKLALVSIARSREALRSLGPSFDAAATARLIAALDEIERVVDDRFPDARGFIRVGLDVPVS